MGAAAQVGQLGLGALGLMNAQNEARSARDQQDRYMQRFDQAYQQVKGWLDEMKGRGAFDAGKRIDAIKNVVNQNAGIDMNNAAAATRIAGYKPGDTAGQDMMTRVGVNNQRYFAGLANDITNQALQDEFNAVNTLSNASGILSGQGSMVQNRYNQAQAGLSNAGAGFGNILANTDWNAFKIKRPSSSVAGAGLYGPNETGQSRVRRI